MSKLTLIILAFAEMVLNTAVIVAVVSLAAYQASHSTITAEIAGGGTLAGILNTSWSKFLSSLGAPVVTVEAPAPQAGMAQGGGNGQAGA